MGYAEEYDVSRYFVDARVLSIFEGADETRALKVGARRLVETAARAVGVMQAAYEAGRDYAANRVVFGQPIVEYQLSRAKLGRMVVVIQAARQFMYQVGRLMAKGEGQMEASMVKAYVCRAAEWVTREAMQLHGGMGYAEEFPVSRLFVDARVLSIFEGADETLCLKVIARRLVESGA
jgi:(2S)-methylsuccinyl-CoA dehydrogenase